MLKLWCRRQSRDTAAAFDFAATVQLAQSGVNVPRPIAYGQEKMRRVFGQHFGLSIIRYYNVWNESRDVPRGFCLVRYEDLHADTAKELRRIFDFLEIPDISDAHIREFGSFGNMRSMESSDTLKSGRLRARDSSDVESFKTRRGVVGGYVDYLDAEEKRCQKDLAQLAGG